MGSISFHAGAEGKITRNNVKGMSGHTMRNSKDGYRNHSNKEIDKSLTKYNVDWMRDGKPLHEMVEDRLENEFKGQRKLRKDAVVIREIIAQPPPELFEGLDTNAKGKKAVGFANDSLDWFREEFGDENVMALSLHLDETNPHMHVSVMPMTSDGRMSQKDFFKGPNDLKRQHREYREHMVGKGWDIDIENKYEDVDGLSLPKYKANAKEVERKRVEQRQTRDELIQSPDLRQQVYDDIHGRVLLSERRKIAEREKVLAEREEALVETEKVLAENEKVLIERRDRLRDRNDDIRRVERAHTERNNKTLGEIHERKLDLVRCIADVSRGFASQQTTDALDNFVQVGHGDMPSKVYRSVINETVQGALSKGKAEALQKRSKSVVHRQDDGPDL